MCETPAVGKEPGLFSTLTQTALNVAGLVLIIGEVADGANVLFYLAEGNKVAAALSADLGLFCTFHGHNKPA